MTMNTNLIEVPVKEKHEETEMYQSKQTNNWRNGVTQAERNSVATDPFKNHTEVEDDDLPF